MGTVPHCRDYPARAGPALPRPGPADPSRPRGLTPAARTFCRRAWWRHIAPAVPAT